MYALSKHKQNPYLKANRKKMAKFTKAVILSIINFLTPNFFMQIFNVSLLCREKYQKRVDWPVYALFKYKHNPCLKASREKSWEKLAKFTKLSFCQ